ncbi:angio-associated migratory cell protein-like [Oscarella lobularis]|uniref:angio-associated migratory cell protein-like n=1 Tax=Oscarella lobularis TaxID=121494 RepID=UPI0033139A6F
MDEEEDDLRLDAADLIEVPDADEEIGISEALEDMDMMNRDERDDDVAVSVFRKHEKAVFSVSLNANLVASGGEDDRAFVWTIENSETPVFECKGHKDSVTCTGFSRDGHFLATGDMSGVVRVWNTETGLEVWGFECGDLEWLVWHSGAPVLLAGTTSGVTWMWKIPAGDAKTYSSGSDSSASCGKLLPDGKRLAVGYGDGRVRVWDLKGGDALVNVIAHQGNITCIECCNDGSLVASGSDDGSVRFVNPLNGKIVAGIEQEREGEDSAIGVESFGFCSHLPIAAIGYLNGCLKFWDMAMQRFRNEYRHPGSVVRLLWHPSEPFVFTCCLDGIVRLCDGRNGQCLTEWHGHDEAILDMVISIDGSTIVTGSEDSTCRVFKK